MSANDPKRTFGSGSVDAETYCAGALYPYASPDFTGWRDGAWNSLRSPIRAAPLLSAAQFQVCSSGPFFAGLAGELIFMSAHQLSLSAVASEFLPPIWNCSKLWTNAVQAPSILA